MAANWHAVLPYWFIVQQETGHNFATSSDSKISRFTHPHVIRFIVDLFFPLWRADLQTSVEFAGYVWTEAVSRKKKLRIQKYPDSCGRGLN